MATGPGHLAVELAGRACVATLDTSHTFAAMVGERAAAHCVTVDSRQGDAATMPFADASFDLIICQAAFTNVFRPVGALNEMHRVLRPGGVAMIEDLDPRATRARIAAQVGPMRLTGGKALYTRVTLGWLRRRAHTPEQLTGLARRSEFTNIHIERYGTIGLRLTLKWETA
ncbi:hypothetical protein JCM9534A_79770 [Catenuloplanes indicus JCM 9534]|uniref:Ubiquinone/menaquinone biosynthesis C-methylase UbiE n=1 Tax=Catenuloplanes indicus TaxID=137267 RepID=A0AAE4B0G5_9ACTN|nr:ubiquinone/menaquinone biosynthesis C-methylase UbiE [Catenuloplanes indicus]